ncbi:MAG: glycine cleavage T C-terminal barrel domain-containing protein, partial [Gammaproteobacteria bacterium]|nr:glycine cleavage T C-terminal barrel domain-containing protein [Gammaproteobacteria bacterium]
RDVFAMDVARYGTYCTKAYTRNKVRENYQKRFSISYPNEELPAGRPLNTTPAYSIWQQQRAVFGQGYGMEHVNYFALEGEPLEETPSFRRSNAFAAIGNECRAVRNGVGINEVHNFGKYLVTGSGARTWLDKVMAGKLPLLGRVALSPMLSLSGKLMGDFTISHIAKNEYQLTASFGAQDLHMRWFEQYLPANNVTLKNISMSRIGFQIAGPKARHLLAACTRFDVSHSVMPFLSVQKMEVGQCDAIVQRVSYTGDLGYEIYVPVEQQVSLYHALADAGVAFGLKPFGMRAMMSLRLEKSFGSWMREYKPDYTPMETGMDRFMDYHKSVDYIGKAAALAELKQPPKRRLVSFVVDVMDADVVADEPIWKDGTVVGFVTSGGYAHFSEKSVALGFVPTQMIEEGALFEIEILGEMRPATLYTACLFDPSSQCTKA